ncbi:MAG: TRAP transporter large permease subunit, partial [Proteobacteria bacterium]|nr:TRAP transporter large permease subunit [Pseudomonadota bacterium]
VAEDLLIAMAQLFGPIPGGLGIAVVFVGALLAATTGIVGATVIAMGLISLPVMMRNNYSTPLATGTIAASGTLGQIIPPSIVLIILADQLSNATGRASTMRKAEYAEATGSFSMPIEFDLTSTSAGDMFLGAFLPGMVLVGLYMGYILIVALIKPKDAPPVPYEGKYDAQFFKGVLLALVPPLALIFTVLGSIVLGVATVNQAGAIGAVGAMIMAGYRLMHGKPGAYTPVILAVVSIVAIVVVLSLFEINVKGAIGAKETLGIVLAVIAVTGFLTAVGWSCWRAYKIDDILEGVMVETAKTTSLVFIILLGAAMLTAAFRAFGGEEVVKEFLSSLPGGFMTKFVVVMAVIFLLGFFLDFIEIAVVVVPIVAPILLADPASNITAVWLGVMIGVNMQTSFLTPPFGFALFYLRGVAPPEVRTMQIYRGVVPFILLQLTGLAIVGAFPFLVNYLPNRVQLSSETAPPPINPLLQQCIERYVFEQYALDHDVLRASIETAKALDVSYLPEANRAALAEGFDAALATFGLVDAARVASAQLEDEVAAYRALHRQVRALQGDMRAIAEEIEAQAEILDRLVRSGAGLDVDMERLERRIESLAADRRAIEVQIPDEWETSRETYLALEEAEKKARLRYRRNVDSAYEPVMELRLIIAQSAALSALEGQILGLAGVIADTEAEQARETIKEAMRALRTIAGTSAITGKLSKARRALKGAEPDREKAQGKWLEGFELFKVEIAWRRRAAENLAAGLDTYDNAIKSNIGLRLQEKLTSDQAAFIAACRSTHVDISLSF